MPNAFQDWLGSNKKTMISRMISNVFILFWESKLLISHYLMAMKNGPLHTHCFTISLIIWILAGRPTPPFRPLVFHQLETGITQTALGWSVFSKGSTFTHGYLKSLRKFYVCQFKSKRKDVFIKFYKHQFLKKYILKKFYWIAFGKMSAKFSICSHSILHFF